MKDCSFYLKKLYIGGLIFLFNGILLQSNFLPISLSVIIGIVLFVISQILILPYFRCYGENMRNNKKFRK